MSQLRSLGVVVLVAGTLFSRPAAAQIRDGVSSLTHVVSVTVPARVKVKVSSIMMSPQSVPAAVKITAARGLSSGLALRVHANQAWVLSVSAPASREASSSKMGWSESSGGIFSPITAADSLLAAGTKSPASVDRTVFFQGGKNREDSTGGAVVLTVSAP